MASQQNVDICHMTGRLFCVVPLGVSWGGGGTQLPDGCPLPNGCRGEVMNANILVRSSSLRVKKGSSQLQIKNLIGAVTYEPCLILLHL